MISSHTSSLDAFYEGPLWKNELALQAHGMQIMGPLIDLEKPDAFVFLRGHIERFR